MKKKKELAIYFKRLLIIVIILWMTLIFKQSSKIATESYQLSTKITERLITILQAIIPDMTIDKLLFEFVFRKLAHFCEFFILAILFIVFFKNSGLKRRKLLAFIICGLYAVTDEVHQIFVSGRGAGVADVVIDMLGALAGIGLYHLAFKLFSRNRVLRGKVETAYK
ncbi:MAG: hypothetical protein K0S76_576 [Herbinix sp.]|nr:hypothetical protein [Herbinix sp.]